MLKDDLLAVVRLMRLRPTDLLKFRGREYGEIQDALSSMLESGEIILSSDRYLEIPQKYDLANPSWFE